MNKNRPIFFVITFTVIALVIRLILLKYAYPNWWHGMTLEGYARNVFLGYGFTFDQVDALGNITKIPFVHDVPGYAYLLALTWKIFGGYDLIYVQVLQILLDSLCCIIVYKIAKHFFSERVALIASFLYAIYLPEAYLAVNVGRDVYATFGFLGAISFVIKYFNSRKIYFLILSAAFIGFASYFRPTCSLLPVFLFPVFWLRNSSFLRACAKSFLMLVIVHLILFPWAYRNHQYYGKWIFTRDGLNQGLWEGFGQFPNSFGAVYNDDATLEDMIKKGYTGTSNSVHEYEEYLKPYVQNVLKNHTGWYIGSIIRRIPMAIVMNRMPWGILQNPQEFSYHRMYTNDNNQKGYWDYAKKMLKLNPGFLITKVFDIIILVLAFSGIIINRRNWRKEVLLWSVPLYVIATHIPIAVEGRYLVPSYWVYLIYMAVAIQYIYLRILDRQKNNPRLK